MKKFLSFRLFAWTALLFALLGTLSVSLSFITAFDPSIGYFFEGSILPMLSILFLVLFSCGLLFDAVLLLRRRPEPFPAEAPLWLRGINGLLFLAFLVLTLRELLAEPSLVFALLGVAAASHFLLRAARTPSPLLLTVSGICAILRIAASLAQIYFDNTVPMNAPVKIYLQLGCICGMLLLVREMKASLFPKASWLSPLALGLGALFTGTASVPLFLAAATDTMDPSALPDVAYPMLILFVYSLARLVSLILYRESQATDPSSPAEEPEQVPSPERAPDADPS